MADEKRLERIENKVDKLDDHLANIDITLAKQSVILEEHVKRTNALEQRQTMQAAAVALQLEPIKKHVDGVKGVGKFIGLLALLATIAEVVHLFWH